MLNEPTQSSNNLCGETQAKQNEKYHTEAQPKDKPTKMVAKLVRLLNKQSQLYNRKGNLWKIKPLKY